MDGNFVGVKSIERLLRRLLNPQGPAQFAQRVLGAVQPSIEVRPVYDWEMRDAGIVSWRCFVPSGAVAAQFSYGEVGLSAVGAGQYDIIVTDLVTNGQPAFVRLHTTSQAAGAAASPQHQDSYWTPNLYGASFPPVQVRSGAVAAPGGTIVDGLIANSRITNQRYILRASASSPFVSLFGIAVNTAIEVVFGGFLIPTDYGI